MRQSYPTDPASDHSPTSTDDNPRPTIDAMFNDWRQMAAVARGALTQVRDLQARVAELEAQQTETLGVLDALRCEFVALCEEAAQLREYKRITDLHTGRTDPLRLIERRSAYVVKAVRS